MSLFKRLLPPLCLILLALLFRVTYLDYIEFKSDEAINLYLTARPLFGYGFTPGGTESSIGILNPPLFNYLIFPFVLFSRDPRFISFCIGLLNSLAIGGLYVVLKRYYSRKIAFITSLLLAICPWAILFSRKIWMQDLLIPVLVPFIFSVHQLITGKQKIAWTIYTVCALFLIQLHQGSVFFVFLISLFLYLYYKPKINISYVALGFVIGLLPFLPYAVYEFINKCPDCSNIVNAHNRVSQGLLVQLNFARPFEILNQGDFHIEMGDSMIPFASRYQLVYQLRKFFYLEYLLLPLGLLFFVKKYRKYVLFAFACVLLPLIYFILKVVPHMHYYIILIPFLFLFISVGISHFMESKTPVIRFVTLFFLSSLILLCIAFNISFFSLLKDQKGLKGDYGTAFIVTKESNEKLVNAYKGNKNYDEMVLVGYIPDDAMLGNSPVGRAIYNTLSNKDLAKLEKQWRQRPHDPILFHSILAIYTRATPSLSTLDALHKKGETFAPYQTVYKITRDLYQHSLLKRYFYNGLFHFYYPQHWRLSTEEDRIKIQADDYEITINKLAVPKELGKTESTTISKNLILSQNVDKYTCIKDDIWCGTIYSTIKVGQDYILVTLKPNQNAKFHSKNLKKIYATLEELLNSIRKYN